MLETIEVYETNGILEVLSVMLFKTKSLIYINQKKYEISSDTIDKIIRIVRFWNNTFNNNDNIDNKEIKLILNSSEVIIYKNSIPDNYNELISIIRDIEDGKIN